jgi:predicted ATP-dependent Lon-type protease
VPEQGGDKLIPDGPIPGVLHTIATGSGGDIPSIPGELFAKFQTSFYADPVDAVVKALGVE